MEFNEARDAVPRTSDSDSRRAVVQNLKESISPVTEELVPVFEVLTDLEINPEEEIELFKDIAMYLIMKTSAENRYQGLYEDLGENPRLLQNHLEVIGAIENVFGYRVSNLHGRDAPEIAERIGHLSVEKLNFAVLRNYNE